jgi:hypothetical protein
VPRKARLFDNQAFGFALRTAQSSCTCLRRCRRDPITAYLNRPLIVLKLKDRLLICAVLYSCTLSPSNENVLPWCLSGQLSLSQACVLRLVCYLYGSRRLQRFWASFEVSQRDGRKLDRSEAYELLQKKHDLQAFIPPHSKNTSPLVGYCMRKILAVYLSACAYYMPACHGSQEVKRTALTYCTRGNKESVPSFVLLNVPLVYLRCTFICTFSRTSSCTCGVPSPYLQSYLHMYLSEVYHHC